MAKSANEVFRDYVRYTGDGKPNAPVGKPLPIGDPSSGVHNPPKADIREVFQSAYDAANRAEDAEAAAQAYAGMATGTPQFANTAEVTSVTIPAYTNLILVGDRIYIRDDTDGALASADGKRWTLLDFRGQFDRMVSDMLQGSSVHLIAYGDSTTDGNGTTDWTANPVNGSNQAIGSAPHTPPNAWPAVAQSALRSMFSNASISVHNAGYAGRRLYDGWAYANFNAAINPYPAPRAVMVQFGINDVRDAAFTPTAFETQLLLLCRRIARAGAFPIFVTPDEPSMSGRNGSLIAKANAIYRSVAARIGVQVIDWGLAQNEMSQCSDATPWRWAADQPDDTHGNDYWHSAKGGFVAASIYPNTLWLREEVTDVAPWSRFAKPKENYTVAQITANKYGAASVYDGGTYATNEVMMDCWVWSVGAARNGYFMAVDSSGYYSPRTLANAPVIGMRSWASRVSTDCPAPGSGAGVSNDNYRFAEAAGFLFRVPQGLSRWAFRAPQDTNANDLYIGYLSFRAVRPQFAVAVPMFSAAAEPRIIDRDEGGDIQQVFGYWQSRPLNLAITLDVQPGLGVALWSSRVYGSSVTRESNRKRGLFLFRHATDDRLFLYDATFHADGTIVASTSLGATSALTWSSAARRLRITAAINGSDQVVRIYDGWATNTPALESVSPFSDIPRPYGGTPGAVWQHNGATGVAALTIYGDI